MRTRFNKSKITLAALGVCVILVAGACSETVEERTGGTVTYNEGTTTSTTTSTAIESSEAETATAPGNDQFGGQVG